MKTGGCQELEEARQLPQSLLLQQGVHNLADFSEGPSEIILADLRSIHSNPFVHPDQMRRSVKTGAVTGLVQDAGQHGRRGPFPIRARDNGGGILQVGIPQAGKNLRDRFQPPLQAMHFLPEAVQKF